MQIDRQDLELRYDITKIMGSPHYYEAKEHLKKDLPVGVIKPEDLQCEVISYNNELSDLITGIIPTRIRECFKNMIPVVEGQADYGVNTVHLPNLSELLVEYWIGKIDRNLVYGTGGQLWIEGQKAIAMIAPEDEARVREVVGNLKNDGRISSVLNGNMITGGLRVKRNGIIASATNLGKYIRDRIVFKINSEEYSTVCDSCPEI